jgi:hypothetical protein
VFNESSNQSKPNVSLYVTPPQGRDSILVGKPDGKRNSSNQDLKNWGVKIWNQNRVQCEAVVKTVRNLQVP